MKSVIWGPAFAGAVVLATGLQAQTLDQVTGPANPPPASFKGQQFIDSRGCVFVRAGFGGRVNWVPRVDARHRPICNMGGGAEVVDAPMPAPDAPMTAPPQPLTAPRQGGGLFAWLFAAPPAPPQAPVMAPAPAPVEVAVAFTNPVRREVPKPPKGWEIAWKDGRLNPMRGVGTPAGQAAQNQIWTQTVPMVEIADLPVKAQAKARAAAQVAAAPVVVATMSAPQTTHVTASTMSAPTANGAMIQVGCFGDPANAARTGARIAELGLPVSTGVQKGLKLVMAGPFATASEAAEGLAALRAAGFTDAFLR